MKSSHGLLNTLHFPKTFLHTPSSKPHMTYFHFTCNSQAAVVRCSVEHCNMLISTAILLSQILCLKILSAANCRIEIRKRDMIIITSCFNSPCEFDVHDCLCNSFSSLIVLLLWCHTPVINNIRMATSSCLQNGNIDFSNIIISQLTWTMV